jgi:hypothetical protein
MRIAGALVALACLGALAAAPTRAEAQNRTITCESRGDDRHECFVGNLDQASVYMARKLSQSDCDKFESWGTSRDKIWVSRGCRAVFSYRTGGSSYDGDYGGGGGSLRTITCESKNGDRKECYVANLDDESVTMDKLLSETLCQKGRNWDAEGNVIWVRDGCRARFNYVTRGGGNYGNGNSHGGGSHASARNACLERASREWGVTKDNLEIKGTNRLDNGELEVMVASKRTSGSCYVSSSGRVQRLSTY